MTGYRRTHANNASCCRICRVFTEALLAFGGSTSIDSLVWVTVVVKTEPPPMRHSRGEIAIHPNKCENIPCKCYVKTHNNRSSNRRSNRRRNWRSNRRNNRRSNRRNWLLTKVASYKKHAGRTSIDRKTAPHLSDPQYLLKCDPLSREIFAKTFQNSLQRNESKSVDQRAAFLPACFCMERYLCSELIFPMALRCYVL